MSRKAQQHLSDTTQTTTTIALLNLDLFFLSWGHHEKITETLRVPELRSLRISVLETSLNVPRCVKYLRAR